MEKGRISKKERVVAVFELRQTYKLADLLVVAGLSKSTYYYTVNRLNKPDKHAETKNKIQKIFEKNKGRYGYRRITLALRSEGVIVNHKTVSVLMKELGLSCKVRSRRYQSYRGKAGKTAPNLLNRNFKSNRPNEKWVTDVTEFSLFGEKIYLAPILDLFNGEIISYQIEKRPSLRLVTDMLKKALRKLPAGTMPMLHSDQGWQYRHKVYQSILEEKHITQSMSRKGNCLDNAVIENFFGHLKSELLYLQNFDSIEHFIFALKEYLHYYNHHRIRTTLNGLSPIQFRKQSLIAA